MAGAHDITILDGPGDSNTDGTGTFQGDVTATPGTVNLATTDSSPTSIYESELEGIPATTNIDVETDASITINQLTTDHQLSLQQTPGNFAKFVAGAGGFSMDSGDTIATAGGSIIIMATGSASIGSVVTTTASP